MSLNSVRERMAAAAARSGRDPESTSLVVVSKERPLEAIMELYEQGHRDFGENRAAELAEKASRLPGDIRWHFVGHLQSNKARSVRPVAAVLHSLDRVSLASAWLKGAGASPPVYLQVNVGREPQKFGVDPDDAAPLVAEVSRLGIKVVGLMAIVPMVAQTSDTRPHFARLRDLRDDIARDHPGVTGLSMGMTDDFEVAIEEGATCIRVGRAIFEQHH